VTVRPHRYLLRAVALAVAPLLLASLAHASSRAQSPGLTPPATLADARLAEHDGDLVSAVAAYQSLARAADPATAAQGSLGLGRVFETSGRAADAIGPLQTAQHALAGSADGLRATFLLAEAEADSGANDAATAGFAAYIAGGGPAAGYAAIERALAFQAEHDDADALSALAAPLQAQSLIIRRVALRSAALSHERLDNLAGAVADQRAVPASKPSSAESVAALREIARLDALAGDNDGATAALQQIVQSYPANAAAAGALDKLDAANVAIEPLQRAIVQFNADRDDDASTTLQAILTGGPSATVQAEALDYLGRIADGQDRADDTLDDYAQATVAAPGSSFAADALWRRAQLLRALNRYDEARDGYTALSQQYPQSANAAEAAFDTGLMSYLGGHANDAATAWSALAQSGAPADAARADLWLAKLALGNGDHATADSDLARAQTLQPTGYFGLRAQLLAANASPSLTGPSVAAPANDWTATESWLSAHAGPENPVQFQALTATQDWREGLELAALGWTVTPPPLLNAALATVKAQPWALYRAARTLSDAGLMAAALNATNTLLAAPGLPSADELSTPIALLRLAYPLDYSDLFNREGARDGLDPLLLASVARQESGFDPAIGSSAGAIGLLQLVPSTAQDVATAADLGTVGVADLRRAALNRRLGAAYLAAQAKNEEGDLARALAAYNGGGGNVARWAKRSGSDPDLFYETIDFAETRAYLRAVSDNYAIYTFLYRGAARPALPHA
jgi:soluble lytic murein transglycosylase